MFAGLSPAGFEVLDRHVGESVVPAGHAVVRAGDRGRHLFVIDRGMVRVVRVKKGVECELARLREGDFFGEVSLLDPDDRSADVIATEETRLLILPKVAFEILSDERLPDYARFLENLARELAHRMRWTLERWVQGT